jgi:hypothetical protein
MSYTKVFALVALAASAAMAQGTIYCASDDMRRHYCAVDTRGGVNLARQRSDASCIAGRTWGYDGRGIWVDRGCRADFYLNSNNAGGYGPYNNGRGGPYYGGNSGPYYGNGGYGNGGYSNGGYGNGGYSNGGYGNYGGASRITCSSDDMRRHYCSANTSGGVQLIRQHSQAACIEGRTWGYNRSGVWVDRGCRAEFAVNTGGSSGGYNGNGRRGRYNPYYTDPNRGAWRPW